MSSLDGPAAQKETQAVKDEYDGKILRNNETIKNYTNIESDHDFEHKSYERRVFL